MYPYLQVELFRSEASTVRLSIPPWELPVLQAVHTPERLTVVGQRMVDRAPPEAGVEYDRLAEKYKSLNSAEGEVKFVEMAYGLPPRGVQTLAQAIRDAVREAEAGAAKGAQSGNAPEDFEPVPGGLMEADEIRV